MTSPDTAPFVPATSSSSSPSHPSAPPLPPRGPSPSLLTPPDPAIAYSHPYSSHAFPSDDPRSSSQQSLLPDESHHEERRKLLLIYIHGFMGAETSFQSFPAHVHNLLRITLAESHVVHTKIYPRYKTRQKIQVATEDFSRWLTPHESPTTDVVLLGHSMGGLVAAQVVLLPPYSPSPGRTFRHRILGTINFDVPFLGLHPGVIGSGIASLFRPADELPPSTDISDDANLVGADTESLASISTTGTTRRRDTLYSQPQDPNFNPAWSNDVNLKVRKGWRSLAHFVAKHSDGLRKATTQYVRSHIEFGGAMADYPSLKERYMKIRMLEDENGDKRKKVLEMERIPPRVRFLNYYTASTGRPRKEKSPSPSQTPSRTLECEETKTPEPPEPDMQRLSLSSESRSTSTSPSPRISIEELGDDNKIVLKEVVEPEISPVSPSHEEQPLPSEETISRFSTIESTAETSSSQLSPTTTTAAASTIVDNDASIQLPNLPPIPDEPPEPPPLDLTPYQDKDAQKLAQRQHDRLLKAYKQAIKDRNEAIKDREKLIDKFRKARAKEDAKKRKDEEKLAKREMEKDAATVVAVAATAASEPDTGAETEQMRECAGDAGKDDDEAVVTSIIASSSSGTLPASRQTTATESYSALISPAPATKDADAKPEKPKKDRKFCLLAKDSQGHVDKKWVRVYMEGVDEVGAHCGLFYFSESYERLVGDVVGRVEEWVREDATKRFLSDEEAAVGEVVD